MVSFWEGVGSTRIILRIQYTSYRSKIANVSNSKKVDSVEPGAIFGDLHFEPPQNASIKNMPNKIFSAFIAIYKL